MDNGPRMTLIPKAFFTASVISKGRVTIPRDIREYFELNPGKIIHLALIEIERE